MELSFTKSRNPRYIIQRRPEEEWVRLPIEHVFGTEPIPPEVADAARKAPRPRGRTMDGTPSPISAQCICPARLLRCARCGYPIREQAPHPNPPRVGKHHQIASYRSWMLRCTCTGVLQRLRSLTNAEARQLPETQHTRYIQASLTIPLKQFLNEKVFGLQIVTPGRGGIGGDPWGERSKLEEERTGYQQQLAQLVANMTLVDFSHLPDAKAQVEAQMDELQTKITVCDARLGHLAAVIVTGAGEQQQTLWSARERYMGMVEEYRDDVPFWRNVVEAFVEKIVVDLDAATFTVHCHFRDEALRQFCGKLLRAAS